jgi:hypothetical protein
VKLSPDGGPGKPPESAIRALSPRENGVRQAEFGGMLSRILVDGLPDA